MPDTPYFSRRGILTTGLGLAGAGALGTWSTAPAAALPAAPYAAGQREPYRPGVHFTPARNWMNDPNGLIHHRGRYHLFFQYNPSGNTWGNMSWGHAVSSDLVHWEELPVALPQDEQEMVFSGSVVCDRNNTSGLGTTAAPPLVAVYTSMVKATGGQRQSLAFSTDDGTTWTKYSGNPVLDIGSDNFRDPKVFWHAPTGQWVMAVALAAEHRIRFYGSPDLRHWTHLSDFGPSGATGGVWECPDLFPLTVDGDPLHTRWVLVVNLNPGGPAGGSGAQYFIGDFDGHRFTADPRLPARWLDHGADAYAAATYNDAPDGRRIMIAWMNNWLYGEKIPTSPWRSAMTFPRELGLRATADGGTVLVQRPVGEVRGLRGRPLAQIANRPVEPGATRLLRDTGQSYEIEAELRPDGARRFGLDVRTGAGHRTRIGYDTRSGELFLDRTAAGEGDFAAEFPAVHRAPVGLTGGGLRLRLLVDASSVEVFADGEARCLTDQIFPGPADTGLEVFAEGGGAHLTRLTVWPLGTGKESASIRPKVVTRDGTCP
ncbi:glycoside hydrolase family 32 protein [Streptomyces sp. NPDC048434]|uniref:glycoside hydrolase family 32 protein n=1 Tax=Streptomyces sp. NPDC048434 TaxID=3365549 RepID=UPI0037138434